MKGLLNSHAAPARLRAGLLWLLLAAPGYGADTPSRFLDALREAGHDDLALEYLDRASDDPLVSEAFRERLPEQRLATLYTQALGVRDVAARQAALEALLPEARKLGTASRLVTDITDRAANAAADAARRALIAGRRKPAGADRRAAVAEAGRKLEAARERLAEAESRIEAEQETLKGVRADSTAGLRRKELRERLGLVQFQRGRLLHELAQTHPAGSAENKKLNRQAAAELREAYEGNQKLGAGFYAHLYEGRCYRALGEDQLAVAALEDLTSQPSTVTALRGVMTLAHAELAALWSDREKPERALAKPAAWYEELSARERRGAEGAELAYRLGAAALQAAARQEDKKQADRARRDAREWLAASGKSPHELQAEARQLWAEVTASLGIEKALPEDFAEAYRTGVEAIEAMLAIDLRLKRAAGAERDRLIAQRSETRESAYEALTTATELADERVDPEQAARARYQLAWLDWEAGDAALAAKRAEGGARGDAKTESGEEAAKLALAALERLAREGDAGAAERLNRFAAYVTETWPSGATAQSAATVRVSAALRAGDFDAARDLVAGVPEEIRPQLALRVAVADWEKSKSAEAFAEMEDAFAVAVSGGGESAPLTVTTALYLAQAALGEGDAGRARGLLTHGEYGPATRLDAGAPPTNNPAVALATLGALVRADALGGKSVNPSLGRVASLLDKAPSEKTGGPRAWLAIAAGLYADAERAADGAKPAVAAGLGATLDRLVETGAPEDWNTRLWIAQAQLRCHELLADESARKKSLNAAAESLGRLVAQAEADASFAPSKNALLAARLRLAQSRRRLGDYEAAMESLGAILASGAVLLEVQLEAAATLQAWGAETGDAELLRQAISGARPGPDKKNLVWGWSKLAAITGRYAASDPKRKAQFFDAWLRVAQCRLESARLTSGATRDKHLSKAATVIRALQGQNPDLGGVASRQRFDKLLREIQTAAGNPATGLERKES